MRPLGHIAFLLSFCSLGCSTPGQVRGDQSQVAIEQAPVTHSPRTAVDWRARAISALKEGKPDLSDTYVFEALKIDPKLTGLKSIVLEAAGKSGRRLPPETMWSFRNEGSFLIPRFWSERGRFLFTRKKYKAAVADLKRAVGLRPRSSVDWAFLARAQAILGQPEEAAQAGLRSLTLVIERKALTSRKRWALLQFIVANAVRVKRTDLAAEAGLLWLSQPGSPDIVSFLRSVRWPGEVSLLMYRRTLDENPGHSAARFEFGRLLFRLGAYQEATDVLRVMSRRAPRWAQALEMGAEAAHRSGQHERAIWMVAQLKEVRGWASRRRPKEAVAGRHRVVRALMRGKRHAWARSEAHLELQTHPQDPELLYLFAVNTALAVSEEAGYEAMLKVLKVAPDHVFALNFVGYSLVVWNRELPRAETLLTQALNAQPDNPSIMDSMGWLYYRKGDFKVAVALLRRALLKQPDSGTIVFHLACALRKIGKIEESEALYRQALKMENDPQERKRFEPEWSAIK